jgi:hypothetical protein
VQICDSGPSSYGQEGPNLNRNLLQDDVAQAHARQAIQLVAGECSALRGTRHARQRAVREITAGQRRRKVQMVRIYAPDKCALQRAILPPELRCPESGVWYQIGKRQIACAAEVGCAQIVRAGV